MAASFYFCIRWRPEYIILIIASTLIHDLTDSRQPQLQSVASE